jgi:hypothetical protein
VHELKDYLRSNIYSLLYKQYVDIVLSVSWWCLFKFWFSGSNADIHVIVKIESADSIPNLHSIITASDGVRGWYWSFFSLVRCISLIW